MQERIEMREGFLCALFWSVALRTSPWQPNLIKVGSKSKCPLQIHTYSILKVKESIGGTMDALPHAPRPSFKPKVVVLYEQLFKVLSSSVCCLIVLGFCCRGASVSLQRTFPSWTTTVRVCRYSSNIGWEWFLKYLYHYSAALSTRRDSVTIKRPVYGR